MPSDDLRDQADMNAAIALRAIADQLDGTETPETAEIQLQLSAVSKLLAVAGETDSAARPNRLRETNEWQNIAVEIEAVQDLLAESYDLTERKLHYESWAAFRGAMTMAVSCAVIVILQGLPWIGNLLSSTLSVGTRFAFAVALQLLLACLAGYIVSAIVKSLEIRRFRPAARVSRRR